MKEINGEHPFGDSGQPVLPAVFLVVWIMDSFILHETTSLTAGFPLSIRLLILAFTVVVAARLIAAGHRAVDHDGCYAGVIFSGAFRYVRHPLYLGSMLAYLGLSPARRVRFDLYIRTVKLSRPLAGAAREPEAER